MSEVETQPLVQQTGELKLDREDLLELSNLTLHAQVASMQKEQLILKAQSEIADCDRKLVDIRKTIIEFQKKLEQKYKFSFETQKIELSTGRIQPV